MYFFLKRLRIIADDTQDHVTVGMIIKDERFV